MDIGQDSPETFTEYKKDPQRLDLQDNSLSSPLLSVSSPKQVERSVVKAAFAFRDGIDSARRRRETQSSTATEPNLQTPIKPDAAEEQAIRDHDARHKFRIRVARGIQHLVTSMLSLIISILQGRTYVMYQQTKTVHGAWPVHADVFPTLLLFSVAVVALTFDVCAIIAYIWPTTKIGHKAFKVCCLACNPCRCIRICLTLSGCTRCT
jgi:hypothetical protein